jgi:ribosomal protein S18 acetylase RimI-like enzyme
VALSDEAVRLRPTGAIDLHFVCSVEQAAEYQGLIGQWSAEQHFEACQRFDQEHLIIERAVDKNALGYLIAYDLRRHGLGFYLKRIAVETPSMGVGRRALRLLVAHAFTELRSDSVWLDVHRTNERAQRAYAAAGFTIVDASTFDRAAVDPLVGPAPEDNLVMRIRSDHQA